MMSNHANPYQSPSPVESSEKIDESSIWKIGFWTGIGLLLVTWIAAFTRNLPPGGFLLVAIFLFVTVTLFSRKYRLRSAIALALSVILLAGIFFQVRTARARMMLDAERRRAKAVMEQARRSAEEVRRHAESQTRTR